MSDFREALAAVIHAKGWPDPVDLPLRPGSCDTCSESLRIADAVLALLAERLGGDEVREAVATAMVRLRWPNEPIQDGDRQVAFAALAAMAECLGVQR